MEDFLKYPRVSTQFPGIPRTIEDNLIADFARAHPPRIRVPSSIAIGSILVGTDMIGIIPTLMAPLLPSAWNLRTLTLPEEFGEISLRGLWHSRHDQDPVHQWMRSTIADICTSFSKTG
jgi:DNA-binding transcriptional LysR family regulator